MLPDPSRAVAAALAFLQAREMNPPRSLVEAIERAEEEAELMDAEGWIDLTSPRRRSWMRQVRDFVKGPDW